MIFFPAYYSVSLQRLQEKQTRNVNLHKTRPRSLAADSPEISNGIFKNRLECGIIFVKYATKAERMLRAAEMREKPI
jgi:hypothetical protein